MQEKIKSINNVERLAVCSVAAAPVRKEPSHRTEMVNQLVFGEGIKILEQQEEWLFVQSLYDNYQGWVTFHLIQEVAEDITKDEIVFASELINRLEINGQTVFIPMGSFLRGMKNDNGVRYQGKYVTPLGNHTTNGIITTAAQWLHVPYLWGGKTVMGVDCSGFVQTVFKLAGVVLQRDAYQQAEQGLLVDLAGAKEGDVAFFHNEKGRITHVGILLNNHQIIHAAGKVRIDDMDENGIQNKELKKQTHQLHSIRRMIDE